MSESRTFPAYGVQRALAERGETDEDGWLTGHPLTNVWNLLKVEGPVDVGRLREAVAAATVGVDALHCRVRKGESGPLCQVDASPRGWELEVRERPGMELEGLLPGDVPWLRELLLGKSDPRNGPLGRVGLVGDGERHLLAIAVDHSVADGWSLGILLQRIARAYRSGPSAVSEGRTVSLEECVRALPDEAERERRVLAWRHMLSRLPDVAPPLLFPGSSPKPAGEWVVDTYDEWLLPDGLMDEVATAADRIGVNRSDLIVSAMNLAVSLWSSDYQPAISQRHGRHRREDVLVVGPLAEPVLMLPPEPGSDTGSVQGWIAGHVRANAGFPSLAGRYFREVGSYGEHNVSINVVPPSRPLRFGSRTLAVPASGDFLRPLQEDEEGPLRPPICPLWVTFYIDRKDTFTVRIDRDTDVVPDPRPPVDTFAAVVRAAARPETVPLAQVRPREVRAGD